MSKQHKATSNCPRSRNAKPAPSLQCLPMASTLLVQRKRRVRCASPFYEQLSGANALATFAAFSLGKARACSRWRAHPRSSTVGLVRSVQRTSPRRQNGGMPVTRQSPARVLRAGSGSAAPRCTRLDRSINDAEQPPLICGTPALLLAERPVDLILQRLDQIRHDRSLAGLNECFGRHPRYEREFTETRKLLRGHGNANDIVG